MILTFRYRLLPTKRQHRALEGILESQRQLYNAALEERIGAYRKVGVYRTLFDQQRALTEWRHDDAEAASLPVALQRWTLRRLDDAYKSFFRRARGSSKAGFPRFRGKGRFDTFGFAQCTGIRLEEGRIRFKGLPGTLRVHVHRPRPTGARIRSCTFHRDDKGWQVGLAIDVPEAPPRAGNRTVGVDLGIETFAVLSDGGFIPSLRAARRTARRLRVAQRAWVAKELGDRLHECPHCGLALHRDLNAALNVLKRAGVGPGLRNVADHGKRASENLSLAARVSEEPLGSS